MLHIVCPKCEATLSINNEYINDKQLHCSVCNKNFNNHIYQHSTNPFSVYSFAQYKDTASKYININKKYVGWIIIGIIVFAILFSGETTPKLGDRVRITTETIGATDESTEKEVRQAGGAKDHLAILQLMAEGRARIIPAGSTGTFIQGGGRVRLDDGTAYWVPLKHIKKIND